MILYVNVRWMASLACMSFAFHGLQSCEHNFNKGMSRDFKSVQGKSVNMREGFRDWNTLNISPIFCLWFV